MIAEFFICIVQFCVIVEIQPYVVYTSTNSCEQAASVIANELGFLLKDTVVDTVVFQCVDQHGNFV